MAETKILTLLGLTTYDTGIKEYIEEQDNEVKALVDTKADAEHDHEIDDVTGLRGELDALQSSIDGVAVGQVPSAGEELGTVKTGGDVTIEDGIITVSDDSHNHSINTVDGLQDVLDGKLNSSAYVVDTELSDTSTNPVQNSAVKAAIDELDANKADTSHTHDDRYYTESEIDTKLSSVNTSISNITNGSITVAKAEEATHAETADTADEATHATSADTATSATTANSATKATQDASGNVITSTYETKVDSSAKLTEAKTYTDTIASGKADVDHNHDTAYDAKGAADTALASAKEYTDEIASGKANASHNHDDIYYTETEIDSKIDAINDAISGKADASHTHDYAASTHNHDDRYFTESEITSKLAGKSDTTHNHDEDYDAIGSADAALASAKEYTNTVASGKANTSHSHAISDVTNLQSALDGKASSTHNHDTAYDVKGAANSALESAKEYADAIQDNLDDHTENTDIHVTTTNKSNWNTAYTHSQSTHARTDATKVADSTTNGNILINGTETNVYTHPSSGVTAGTYKSVTVNAQGHVTGGTNPTTLAGYGITDAESKGAASSALASAKEYTDSVASGKADATHNHDSAYDALGSADSALASAKSYADSAAATVKNDLLNGAGTAYDTLKELGDLIVDNADAIDALETVASGKADKTHSHAIADVSGLQSALDSKAASSHGTHVSYSTTAPVMDGTASVGTASTVSRSDHVHPTDTSRAAKTDLDSHTSNTTAHITSTERSNWNAAYTHSQAAHAPSNAEANQNAFSNVAVGSTTIAADSATDTLTLVAGTNVTITPDATNDKITISATDTNTTYSAGTGISLSGTTFSNSGVRSVATGSTNGTISVNTNGTSAEVAVKGLGSAAYTASSAYDAAGAADDALDEAKAYTDSVASGKANTSHGNHVPTTQTASNKVFLRNDNTWATVTPANIGAAASSHTHTVSNISDLTATATELNYMDGVTSSVQTQLDGKAASSHNHAASNITSGTLSSDRLPTVPIAKGGTGATTAAAALTNLGITATAAELNYVDGVTSNIQTQLNNKAASSHTHSYLPLSGGSLTGAVQINKTAADKASPTSQDLVINYTLPDDTDLTLANSPGIGFHIGGTTWGSMIFDGGFKFVNNSFSGYMPVYASQFNGNLAGNATSATTANSLTGQSRLTTIEGIDNFLTSGELKYTTFKLSADTDTTNLGFGSNDGMLLSIPWTDSTYGAQLAFDDAGGGVGYRNKSTTWSVWRKFLDSGNYKSYVTPSNIGASTSSHKHTVSHTPAGTVSSSFTGKAVTSGSPSASSTVASSTHTHKYTPAGTVSKPTFSGSAVTSGKPDTTNVTTIYSITDVGSLPSASLSAGTLPSASLSAGTLPSHSYTAPSHSYTAPSLTASVSNRCLTLSWSAGSHSFSAGSHSFSAGSLPSLTFSAGTLPSLTFSAGSLPTRSSAISMPNTSHTHSVTASGSVSQPTFTGTEASTTSISGTTSVASSSHTHSVTADGTVSSGFSGTAATLTTGTPT